MRATFRPLPAWPYPEQPARPATYKVGYARTLQDLEREIEAIDGRELILGVVTDEAAIRIDGMLRAVPAHRPDLGPCWEWQGARASSGYGQMSVGGRLVSVHRLALDIALHQQRGRGIGEGLWANHHCDNKVCARPSHLYEGTPTENVSDTWARGRRAS